MKEWARQIDGQRRIWMRNEKPTSDTHFNYLQGLVLQNPYQEDHDSEDDGIDATGSSDTQNIYTTKGNSVGASPRSQPIASQNNTDFMVWLQRLL